MTEAGALRETTALLLHLGLGDQGTVLLPAVNSDDARAWPQLVPALCTAAPGSVVCSRCATFPHTAFLLPA